MEQPSLIAAPEYEIRSVTDFLKVPANRRAICLREFGTWLKIHDDLMTILNGDEPQPVVEFSYFKWIDDGERHVSVVLEVGATSDAVDPHVGDSSE